MVRLMSIIVEFNNFILYLNLYIVIDRKLILNKYLFLFFRRKIEDIVFLDIILFVCDIICVFVIDF